jgi:hypothetical protein
MRCRPLHGALLRLRTVCRMQSVDGVNKLRPADCGLQTAACGLWSAAASRQADLSAWFGDFLSPSS